MHLLQNPEYEKNILLVLILKRILQTIPKAIQLSTPRKSATNRSSSI